MLSRPLELAEAAKPPPDRPPASKKLRNSETAAADAVSKLVKPFPSFYTMSKSA